MKSSKESKPNRLTWEERHPDNYSVRKIFISSYLNHKQPTKISKKASSQKAGK